MYQFWLNTDDRDVIDRLKVFTFLSRAEIERLEHAVSDAPQAREAQRTLAHEVTSIVHGQATALAVAEAAAALFGKGSLEQLDPEVFAQALAELPEASVTAATSVAQALVDTGLCSSLSDARRAIIQGGVSINNEAVADESAEVGPARAPSKELLLLKRGKKTLASLRLS